MQKIKLLERFCDSEIFCSVSVWYPVFALRSRVLLLEMRVISDRMSALQSWRHNKGQTANGKLMKIWDNKSYPMTRHFATINDKICWVMDNFRKRENFLKPELKSVLLSAILSSSIKTSGGELVNFWSWLHICPSVIYTISVRKTGLRIWFWLGACVRALWVRCVFVLCACVHSCVCVCVWVHAFLRNICRLWCGWCGNGQSQILSLFFVLKWCA